jgi:hypothetical protein
VNENRFTDPVMIARRSLNAMYLELPQQVAESHASIVEEAFRYLQTRNLGEGFLSSDGQTIYGWPYCTTCETPFRFDSIEPLAFCDCGTTEWGYPRPAEWVPNPNEDQVFSRFVIGVGVGALLGVAFTIVSLVFV